MRPAKILIDGYNLLFQSQVVGSGRGPGWLERARGRLLRYLESRMDEQACRVTTIVFDAPRTLASAEPVHDFVSESKIDVVFASEHPEADDLLEETIRKHPHPKKLKVVSSDQRVRRCARARRAQDIPAEAFLDELANKTPHGSGLAAIDDPDAGEPSGSELLDAEEVAFWLREFGSDSDDRIG